jgi:hypothetical protein
VIAVQKWRPYLLGQSFKVKTDQQALKFLLEQMAGKVSQQRWIPKLFGYDFVIEYKKGKENRVADALSRMFKDSPEFDTLSISLISFPIPDLIKDLKASYSHNSDSKELLLKLQQGLNIPKGFVLKQGLIFFF